jgi:hypothetical protein
MAARALNLSPDVEIGGVPSKEAGGHTRGAVEGAVPAETYLESRLGDIAELEGDARIRAIQELGMDLCPASTVCSSASPSLRRGRGKWIRDPDRIVEADIVVEREEFGEPVSRRASGDRLPAGALLNMHPMIGQASFGMRRSAEEQVARGFRPPKLGI